MNEEYGYDDGYKDGKSDGYTDGMTDGTAIGYAEGKEETEHTLQEEITSILYHYQQQISDYRYTIRCLREEIYNLRKENETITRSIPKCP